MKIIEAEAAGRDLGALLDLVGQGEEVTILRGGQAVAKIVPTQSGPGSEAAREAARRIREMRKGITLGGIPIRELIDEGRR